MKGEVSPPAQNQNTVDEPPSGVFNSSHLHISAGNRNRTLISKRNFGNPHMSKARLGPRGRSTGAWTSSSSPQQKHEESINLSPSALRDHPGATLAEKPDFPSIPPESA